MVIFEIIVRLENKFSHLPKCFYGQRPHETKIWRKIGAISFVFYLRFLCGARQKRGRKNDIGDFIVCNESAAYVLLENCYFGVGILSECVNSSRKSWNVCYYQLLVLIAKRSKSLFSFLLLFHFLLSIFFSSPINGRNEFSLNGMDCGSQTSIDKIISRKYRSDEVILVGFGLMIHKIGRTSNQNTQNSQSTRKSTTRKYEKK